MADQKEGKTLFEKMGKLVALTGKMAKRDLKDGLEKLETLVDKEIEEMEAELKKEEEAKKEEPKKEGATA